MEELRVLIVADDPLARGGLVTVLEGQPVRHLDDLQGLLDADRVGATLSIRVLRAGEIRELSVAIGQRP